jgi:hypothetical protein
MVSTGSDDLRASVRTMMLAHWRADGHTVPHAGVYPWQWLWDSCFHALIWAELGEAERAVTELRSSLAAQDELGFVPHIRYAGVPSPHAAFWGRPATSSITQPPMYGHAVRELERLGIDVPGDIRDRAVRGVRFLLDHRRRTATGLVTVVHPWETGCDDSPRWDHWVPHGWSVSRWYDVKGTLLATVERAAGGAPLSNPAFAVAPAGFNALLAWNARELGLETEADELSEALAAQWNPELTTWVDDGPSAATSGQVRTADALLPALVVPEAADGQRRAAQQTLLDRAAFCGSFGPASVHRAEPAFDPRAYWRGSSWPQLTYLLWRAGVTPFAATLVAGAVRSGLAEHWHPDTGEGLGARPQSWAGLSILALDG